MRPFTRLADLKAQHNVFNGLRWGPDGWLYGCNGILSNSRVGRPGTPAARRVALNCGVWRYHPTKQVVEAAFGFAEKILDAQKEFLTNLLTAVKPVVVPAEDHSSN